MRILLIGHCHISGIAPALEVATGYDVRQYRYRSDMARDEALCAALKDEIDAADLVGVMSTFATDVADIVGPVRAAKLQLIPHTRASAFHPDILGFTIDGERIFGPMSVSHSALVVQGYLNGLSEAETRSLFNARVFAHLKYFDRQRADLAWAQRQQVMCNWPVVDMV